MKYVLRFALVIFLLIVGQHTLSNAQSSKDSGSITLDQILEKHYEARGGEEAWETISTIKFSGTMQTKKGAIGTAAIFKRPDMCRLDFKAGNLYFVESYDGEVAWQLNPGSRQGPQLLDGKRRAEMIDTCDFDGPLINHEKKGHKIKYLGKKDVDDRGAYVLEVTTSAGNVDTYYLDAETFLPFKVTGSSTIQGNTVETIVNVGEYLEIGDINVPFSYEFIVDGNPDIETLKIKTISLDTDLEDELFIMPKRPQDLR